MSRNDFWLEVFLEEELAHLNRNRTSIMKPSTVFPEIIHANSYSDYGISVKFKNDSGWSNEYTYLYSEKLPVDTLVIVPNNQGFVSVARVKRTIVDFVPDKNIKYKRLVAVLPLTYKDLQNEQN